MSESVVTQLRREYLAWLARLTRRYGSSFLVDSTWGFPDRTDRVTKDSALANE